MTDVVDMNVDNYLAIIAEWEKEFKEMYPDDKDTPPAN